MKALKRIGAGDLGHRVPPAKKDELRDLAESFNAKADQVGDVMSANEGLLLDLSHELRSPITRMKVALEFMASGADGI